MGRPRKTYGASKSEAAWHALEKTFSQFVKDEIKPDHQEDTELLLKKLKESGTWTVAMVEALTELLNALR